MKFCLIAAAALTLAGCSTFKFNRYDPTAPETAAGQAQAEHARAQAELLCSGGNVSQRDDTDGRRTSDWNCNRRKP